MAAVKCRGLFASLNAWIKKPVVSLNMTLTKALFLSCLFFFKPIFHGSVNMAGLKKWFRDDFSRVFSQGVFSHPAQFVVHRVHFPESVSLDPP